MELITGLTIPKLKKEMNELGILLTNVNNKTIPEILIYEDITRVGTYYLLKLCESENNINRYILFEVSMIQIQFFFDKIYSMYELLFNNDIIFIIDMNIDNNFKNIICTTPENLPISYLPEQNSFFNEKTYTKFAKQLKKDIFTM